MQDVQQHEVEENYGELCIPYILNIFSSLRPLVMNTEIDNVFWQNDMFESGASILGFSPLYCNKSAMTTKAKLQISYSVHAGILKFSLCWRSWTITNGNTMVRFLLVGTVKFGNTFFGMTLLRFTCPLLGP